MANLNKQTWIDSEFPVNFSKLIKIIVSYFVVSILDLKEKQVLEISTPTHKQNLAIFFKMFIKQNLATLLIFAGFLIIGYFDTNESNGWPKNTVSQVVG